MIFEILLLPLALLNSLERALDVTTSIVNTCDTHAAFTSHVIASQNMIHAPGVYCVRYHTWNVECQRNNFCDPNFCTFSTHSYQPGIWTHILNSATFVYVKHYHMMEHEIDTCFKHITLRNHWTWKVHCTKYWYFQYQPVQWYDLIHGHFDTTMLISTENLNTTWMVILRKEDLNQRAFSFESINYSKKAYSFFDISNIHGSSFEVKYAPKHIIKFYVIL